MTTFFVLAQQYYAKIIILKKKTALKLNANFVELASLSIQKTASKFNKKKDAMHILLMHIFFYFDRFSKKKNK